MTLTQESTEPRPLRVIAADVERTWPKIYYGARPYLDAMYELDKITDMYYQDSAAYIVRYFLGNANTWRGEDAQRIKAELRALLETTRL